MNVIAFDNLPSTNAYAKENIKELKHKDIILAQTQSEGKGRMQRVWLSPHGGLYFTIVLKPQDIDALFLQSLTQAMALAVCKTINAQGIKSYIKWPNDVLCEGKKVCGILSQAVYDNQTLSGILIGTGVNIAKQTFDCGKPAAALQDFGLTLSKEAFLEHLINNFEALYEQIIKQGFKAIKQDFKHNFPYLGKDTQIVMQQKTVAGKVFDLDDCGRLLLKTANGTQAVAMGDMDF
jgi:BirA family biotin operon repressor/biotin-[acetyl-CoA-carboxylase] ligase